MISWLDFRDSHCDGEVYQLNERDLSNRLGLLDVSKVPVHVPKKLLGCGVVLTLLALILASLQHSASVRNRLAREAMA